MDIRVAAVAIKRVLVLTLQDLGYKKPFKFKFLLCYFKDLLNGPICLNSAVISWLKREKYFAGHTESALTAVIKRRIKRSMDRTSESH